MITAWTRESSCFTNKFMEIQAMPAVQQDRKLTTDPEMCYVSRSHMDVKMAISVMVALKEEVYRCSARRVPLIQISRKVHLLGKFVWIKARSKSLILVQAVCYCARYQARPTQKHLKEVKRIFKYLKGDLFIMGTLKALLEDTDPCDKTCKFGCQRNKNCTAMSSAEAEYVALSASCAQVRNQSYDPTRKPGGSTKDNPKLEIAVLRCVMTFLDTALKALKNEKIMFDKGSKERSPPHNLRQKPGQYKCCQNHKLIADIENDIMDPVMQ
ncbi:hypothetical protein Tco_1484673 [Tanacetum coccineum]